MSIYSCYNEKKTMSNVFEDYSSPNDKIIFDLTDLPAFVDDKSNIIKNTDLKKSRKHCVKRRKFLLQDFYSMSKWYRSEIRKHMQSTLILVFGVPRWSAFYISKRGLARSMTDRWASGWID